MLWQPESCVCVSAGSPGTTAGASTCRGVRRCWTSGTKSRTTQTSWSHTAPHWVRHILQHTHAHTNRHSHRIYICMSTLKHMSGCTPWLSITWRTTSVGSCGHYFIELILTDVQAQVCTVIEDWSAMYTEHVHMHVTWSHDLKKKKRFLHWLISEKILLCLNWQRLRWHSEEWEDTRAQNQTCTHSLKTLSF